TVSISGLSFTGATASGPGGAILVNNEFVTISDCKFASNKTTVTGGGAIAVTAFPSKLTVLRSFFTDNSTAGAGTDGGAIYVGVDAAVTIQDSQFTGNKAADDGGAVYQKLGTVTILNSTFDHNSTLGAGNGGAIACAGFFFA